MSLTSTIGALGIGKQSVKGSVASSFSYVPATSVNVNASQTAQSLPAEVGGQYFVRGSYKSGVAVSGDASLIVRPDSFGYFLHMLCGSVATHAAGGYVADPTVGPILTPGAGATSLTAGYVAVAYSYTNANGETLLSPKTAVAITSTQQVVVTAVTPLPANATGVNWYTNNAVQVSAAAAKADTFHKLSSNAGGTITITALATTGVVPVSNATGIGPAYTSVFTPFAPAAGADLPWYSLIKDVSKAWAEQYVDVKLAGLRMDISRQQIVTGSASFFGITPSEIAVPGTETQDTGTQLVACKATVALTDEAGIITLPADASAPERVSFDFGNTLSQDEYTVGSYVPYDITLLQKTAGITYDLAIRSPDLRRAVYQNGGSSSWDPTIVRGAITVTLLSTANVPTTSVPFSLTVTIPGADLLMMPIQLSGSQLVRASLSAQVSLGSSGTDTYTFSLTDDKASY